MESLNGRSEQRKFSTRSIMRDVMRHGDCGPSDFRDSMTEPQGSRQSAFENALAELRAGRIETAQVLCYRVLQSAPTNQQGKKWAPKVPSGQGPLRTPRAGPARV